jgi:hypothetical protein
MIFLIFIVLCVQSVAFWTVTLCIPMFLRNNYTGTWSRPLLRYRDKFIRKEIIKEKLSQHQPLEVDRVVRYQYSHLF